MSNLGWLFYKQYYKPPSPTKLLPDDYAQASQRLLGNVNATPTPLVPGAQTFTLQTTYPGLLLGSGYQHETGGTNEFKIGFFFDYATGLPTIPGSSVKGKLRSVFPDFPLKFDKKQGENEQERKEREDAYRKPRIEYLKTLLAEITGRKVDELAIERLEHEMFDGYDYGVPGEEPGRLSVYARDRFLDGVLAGSNFANGQCSVLADDYLTPHHPGDKKMGQFKDPIPIWFLKVKPKVGFTFQFFFQDSRAIPGLTKEHKQALCRAILLDWGIGAKTNVGYGQFVRPAQYITGLKTVALPTQTVALPSQTEVLTAPTLVASNPPVVVTPKYYDKRKPKRGGEIEGKVIKAGTNTDNVELYWYEGNHPVVSVRNGTSGFAEKDLGRVVILEINNTHGDRFDPNGCGFKKFK
jgi:CRISPR-associated protein Cmr6